MARFPRFAVRVFAKRRRSDVTVRFRTCIMRQMQFAAGKTSRIIYWNPEQQPQLQAPDHPVALSTW